MSGKEDTEGSASPAEDDLVLRPAPIQDMRTGTLVLQEFTGTLKVHETAPGFYRSSWVDGDTVISHEGSAFETHVFVTVHPAAELHPVHMLDGRRLRIREWTDTFGRRQEVTDSGSQAAPLERNQPQLASPHPAAGLRAQVRVHVKPACGHGFRVQSAAEAFDADGPMAEVSSPPDGWLLVEVQVPGLDAMSLVDGPEERMVLRDGGAQVLVQRGINAITCAVGALEPPPPTGRMVWRVDVLSAAAGVFRWSGELDQGRTVSFELVLL